MYDAKRNFDNIFSKLSLILLTDYINADVWKNVHFCNAV